MPASPAAIIITVALTAVSGFAQPPADPPAEDQPIEPASRPVTASIHVRGEMGFETEFSGSPGNLTVHRAGAGVDVGVPLGERSLLSLGFEYEYSSYDFTNATGFIAGSSRPFGDINRESLSARFSQFVSKEWSYVVGGGVSLSGEEGSDTGDSLSGVVYAAPRYAFSETFSLGVGVIVATRLEDNAQVLPFVSVDWSFAERWSLSNKGRLGLAVTYSPTDEWELSLGATYESREFRLDRDGPLPGGVGRDRRVPIAFTAAYSPTPRINVEAAVGAHVAQNIELLNSAGDSVADVDADPSPFLSLKLGFRF